MEEASLVHAYGGQWLKDKHVQLGELSSSFLFSRIKQRKWRNQLFMLKDDNGTWLDDQNDIVQLIVNHFKDLYSLSGPNLVDSQHHAEKIDLVMRELHLPILTPFDTNSLLTLFSTLEIQDAMFDIANDKSPGVNGFPFQFFKIHWPTLGSHVLQAVNRFLLTGHLLKEWNRSLLVLIPKNDSPEEVHHLRPISLYKIVYKCGSKCLVNRMKLLLPQLIDNYQIAFVHGRKMGDNILISHDLFITSINRDHGPII